MMTLEELQKKVDNWIHETGGGYFSELTNMALLTEETGELARIIARVYGDQIPKRGDLAKNLGEEIADVLWVLTCIANQTGINLEEEIDANFRKKTERDSERFRSRIHKGPETTKETENSDTQI